MRQKGWSERSGKPFFYILPYEKTRHRRGEETNVSMNPDDWISECVDVVCLRIKVGMFVEQKFDVLAL